MAKEGRKYYEAYEERYRTAHTHGVSWANDTSTPIKTKRYRGSVYSARKKS